MTVRATVTAVRRRRRERGLDPLDRALRRLDHRLGSRRRRPDETLREFAERLPFDASTRAAALVAEQERNPPADLNPEERRRAVRALRRPRRPVGGRRPTAGHR